MKLDFIDLRNELKTLRDNVGFRWLALRSVDLSKPCGECQRKVPDNYDQSYGRCKACLGIGYTYVDKLILGFSYRSLPLFQVRGQSVVGPMGIQNVKFILQHDSNPKPVDWIMELELNETTMVPVQPFKITSAYRIEDVTIYRSDSGRIDFFSCNVLEQNLTLGKPQ